MPQDSDSLAAPPLPEARPAPAARALRVRVIGKANGVGLSRDLELLAAALRTCGCKVQERACERRDRKRRRSLLTQLLARARRLAGAASHVNYDVNIMLEHVWPQFLHEASCNVLVPNPEWFDRRDAAFLGLFDRVWTKTELAEQLFAARGCRSLHIGFDSEDRLTPEIARLPHFLHLGGRSALKGTQRLVALWRQHPEWPRLTVVQDAATRGAIPPVSATNIVHKSDFIEDQELRTLQNAHRFHLCMSEAEGWGHYIAEAASVGAVTFTSDAAPMNELISSERGILVGTFPGEQHNLVRLARFDEPALEQAVGHALRLSEAQLEAISAAARRWFVANKLGFITRVQAAIADIGVAYARTPGA
jgi:hypothetical protein